MLIVLQAWARQGWGAGRQVSPPSLRNLLTYLSLWSFLTTPEFPLLLFLLSSHSFLTLSQGDWHCLFISSSWAQMSPLTHAHFHGSGMHIHSFGAIPQVLVVETSEGKSLTNSFSLSISFIHLPIQCLLNWVGTNKKIFLQYRLCMLFPKAPLQNQMHRNPQLYQGKA